MAAKRTNAYILFCSDNRPVVRQENPNATAKDINSMLLVTWKSISEHSKTVYRNRARDMNNGITNPPSLARKEGMKNYVDFCREKRDSVKRKYPNKNGREITSILASMWKEFKLKTLTKTKEVSNSITKCYNNKKDKKSKIDHLSLLPIELLDHICSFLDEKTLISFSKCSGSIRQRLFHVYKNMPFEPMCNLLFKGHVWLDALCDTFMTAVNEKRIECQFDQKIVNKISKSKIRYEMVHLQQINASRITQVVLTVHGYDSLGINTIRMIVNTILQKWMENANKKNSAERLEQPHKHFQLILKCNNTLSDNKTVCKQIEQMLCDVVNIRNDCRGKVLDISVNKSGYNLRHICTYKLILNQGV